MALGTKGLTEMSTIRQQKGVFLSISDSSILSDAKRLSLKAFLEVTLVSLTFRVRTAF